MASPRCEALGGVCTGWFYCEYAGCAAAPTGGSDYEGSAAQSQQTYGHNRAYEQTGRRRLGSGQMNRNRQGRQRTTS